MSKPSFSSLLFVFILLIILIGCTEEQPDQPSSSTVIHPIEENIPYFNNDHITIGEANPTNEEHTFSPVISTLYDYLNQPISFEISQLQTQVHDATNVDIAFVSDSQIIVLDHILGSFFQYNLNADTLAVLANAGRGPGDIAFTQEMILYGDDVFITMEDMRISQFECHESPCEYVRTIPLEFSPMSIALAEDHLAVLGQVSITEHGFEITENAVSLLHHDGSRFGGFGKFYQSDQPMVLFSMRGGIIRYSMSSETYFLYFDGLPLIYVFDKDYNLTETLKLENYRQGEVVYLKDRNAVTPFKGTRTVITDLNIVDETYMVVSATTFYVQNNNEPAFQHHQNYYAINVQSLESYHIGSQETELHTLITPADGGLILNEDGILYHAIKPLN